MVQLILQTVLQAGPPAGFFFDRYRRMYFINTIVYNNQFHYLHLSTTQFTCFNFYKELCVIKNCLYLETYTTSSTQTQEQNKQQLDNLVQSFLHTINEVKHKNNTIKLMQMLMTKSILISNSVITR